MSSIHVCSATKVEEVVRLSRAGSLVSLVHTMDDAPRPAAITADRHLFLGVADIVSAQSGFVLASGEHVSRLLEFVRAWDRREPMVIHCFAGVSRSTAAAFISACLLNPQTSEIKIAQQIRDVSPTATPNSHLVGLADAMLGRNGRMQAAIASIGRGADCFEGIPFALPVAL